MSWIMKLNEKNIFLLDGIGAVLSATTMGLILPLLSELIGLSAVSLRLLGLVGLMLAIYSLICFFFIKRPKSLMLLIIILANSLYCVLALSIAFISSELTILGRGYFIVEVAIILGVVFLESRVYQKSFASPSKAGLPPTSP